MHQIVPSRQFRFPDDFKQIVRWRSLVRNSEIHSVAAAAKGAVQSFVGSALKGSARTRAIKYGRQ
jgi:hypothetical protein